MNLVPFSMPPRDEQDLIPTVPQPKTKAQALAECLRTIFCCGADAISGSTSKVSPHAEKPVVTAEHVGRIEQVGEPFVGRNDHAIM